MMNKQEKNAKNEQMDRWPTAWMHGTTEETATESERAKREQTRKKKEKREEQKHDI